MGTASASAGSRPVGSTEVGGWGGGEVGGEVAGEVGGGGGGGGKWKVGGGGREGAAVPEKLATGLNGLEISPGVPNGNPLYPNLLNAPNHPSPILGLLTPCRFQLGKKTK